MKSSGDNSLLFIGIFKRTLPGGGGVTKWQRGWFGAKAA